MYIRTCTCTPPPWFDEGRCAELERRYSQAISKNLSDDVAALRAAMRAEAKEDLEHLKEMCDKLREKEFGHLDPGALDPPTGERAMALALVNYPEICREIMKKFCAYGARRLEGGLLDDVRNYLRDSRILHMMVKKAYPKLSADSLKSTRSEIDARTRPTRAGCARAFGGGVRPSGRMGGL